MLYPEPGHPSGSDRFDLEVDHSEAVPRRPSRRPALAPEYRRRLHGHQRSCKRQIQPGGAARRERRKFLLRRGARGPFNRSDQRKSLRCKKESALPDEAVTASLGCGNPTALAELKPGETVLDLGSGGGIDVLLSARRVGPAGKAYGLDMTDEMLALANENRRKSGVENVKF